MIDAERVLKTLAIVLVVVTPRVWFEVCRRDLKLRWERFLDELDPHDESFGRER